MRYVLIVLLLTGCSQLPNKVGDATNITVENRKALHAFVKRGGSVIALGS